MHSMCLDVCKLQLACFFDTPESHRAEQLVVNQSRDIRVFQEVREHAKLHH